MLGLKKRDIKKALKAGAKAGGVSLACLLYTSKEKIGLNEQYEEYAIHDTDNFPIAIGEYVSIDELNEMYEMIEELPDYIVAVSYTHLRCKRSRRCPQHILQNKKSLPRC